MSPPPGPARPAPVARVLRRAFAVLAVLLVVVGALGVGTAVTLKSALDRLTGPVQAAHDANARALQGLTDAETGVRGYQLTGAREFLEPYVRGRAAFLDAVADLEAGAGERVAAANEEQLAAGRLWLVTYADQVARRSAEGDPVDLAERVTNKRHFDAFRAANRRVGAELAGERDREAARLARVELLAVLSLNGAVLAGAAVALLTLRRVVRDLAGPLARLREVVGRLAAGQHSARADVTSGPREVVAVASSVNALADERDRLRAAEDASRRLRRLAAETGLRIREHLVADDAMDAAVQALGAGLGVDRAHVRLLVREAGGAAGRPEGALSGPRAGWRADGLPPVPPLEEVDGGWVAEQYAASGYVALEEARYGTVLDLGAPDDACGVLVVPFGAGAEPLGVIVLASVRPRAWAEREVGVVLAVGADLGRALVHARLYRQQEELVEQLRQLDTTKNDFLSTVSHELRTPLTSISGYVELLRDGDAGEVSAAQDRMLDVIDRNTVRLKALIEDLLTLSRIESGAFRVTVEPLRPADLVASVVAVVRPEAERARLRLEVDAGPPDAVVLGDPGQVERALLNLLSNALKFTPQGGRVVVRARVEDGCSVLEVGDSGIGIPLAEQARLFTRFFRASNATARAVQGTGLGLTIVRSIVEHHGGSLALVSAEGEGTTVRVVLPLVPGAGIEGPEPALMTGVPTSGTLS